MITHSSRQKWAPQPFDSVTLLCYSGQLWYLLNFSRTAGTPALLLPFLNISTAPWHTVQLKSLKTAGCFQLRSKWEWKRRKNNPKSYRFDECNTLTEATYVIALTHHNYILKLLLLSTSRITTLTWKFLNSASKNKRQSGVPCSNNDFCCVQHYFTFSFHFTLKQGFLKKFKNQCQTCNSVCSKCSNEENNVREKCRVI